jgi:hypothetical protein
MVLETHGPEWLGVLVAGLGVMVMLGVVPVAPVEVPPRVVVYQVAAMAAAVRGVHPMVTVGVLLAAPV